MLETGFLAQQQRRSPTGFTLVAAAHIAGLAALALAEPTLFVAPADPPLKIRMIPITPDPDPVRQPRERIERPSDYTTPPRPLPTPTRDEQPTRDDSLPPFVPFDPGPIGERFAEAEGPPVVPRAPVRIAAQLISRDLQPPYPSDEERAQRSGVVRVRLTIGADGRVIAVERLSATSDSFWRATERQARNRWRFRPATEDGRPVVAVREMTVTFRIDDLA